MGTGRFIATRYVPRNVAANAARNGCNVMCYGTSQQARSLANQAYERGNVTRHGPSGHQKHVDYSHYQPTTRKIKGIFFMVIAILDDSEWLSIYSIFEV